MLLFFCLFFCFLLLFFFCFFFSFFFLFFFLFVCFFVVFFFCFCFCFFFLFFCFVVVVLFFLGGGGLFVCFVFCLFICCCFVFFCFFVKNYFFHFFFSILQLNKHTINFIIQFKSIYFNIQKDIQAVVISFSDIYIFEFILRGAERTCLSSKCAPTPPTPPLSARCKCVNMTNHLITDLKMCCTNGIPDVQSWSEQSVLMNSLSRCWKPNGSSSIVRCTGVTFATLSGISPEDRRRLPHDFFH